MLNRSWFIWVYVCVCTPFLQNDGASLHLHCKFAPPFVHTLFPWSSMVVLLLLALVTRHTTDCLTHTDSASPALPCPQTARWQRQIIKWCASLYINIHSTVSMVTTRGYVRMVCGFFVCMTRGFLTVTFHHSINAKTRRSFHHLCPHAADKHQLSQQGWTMYWSSVFYKSPSRYICSLSIRKKFRISAPHPPPLFVTWRAVSIKMSSVKGVGAIQPKHYMFEPQCRRDLDQKLVGWSLNTVT